MLIMMKTKFFLTLFALNGLLLSANSASAATLANVETVQNIINLSDTIANLVDVNDRSLLETAINRALLAQNNYPSNTRSMPIGDAPLDETRGDRQPIINGKVANPDYQPQPDRPLINGIKIRERDRLRQGVDKPLINGIIVKPGN
jgi:hypothetical protein